MNLTSMRYKSFVWPHNPRVYSIRFERSMAVNKIPFGRYAIQNLGVTRQVMRGEGEFVGEGAYDKFRELAELFREDTAGLLIHPLWTAANAWFVGLKLEQEPRADYVRYSFEFWEDRNGGNTALKAVDTASVSAGSAAERAGEGSTRHTVQSGENLWGIAADYGLPLNVLMSLNPQISNPNRIDVGQEVRVAE